MDRFAKRKFQGRSEKFYEVPDVLEFRGFNSKFYSQLRIFNQSFEVRGRGGMLQPFLTVKRTASLFSQTLIKLLPQFIAKRAPQSPVIFAK